MVSDSGRFDTPSESPPSCLTACSPTFRTVLLFALIFYFSFQAMIGLGGACC